ncbi:hypothetical protein SSP531S_01960 [Streptomyces spongiicola]|uniref:Uncharacterized protein n=1 Tax=Streptomyces spongiicola TaxID=1690221 RepID=A0A388SRQ3_9ACTN|nr:hypothetical protein SSP531S_01960 [Streptomyces spongiicola]
MQRVGAESLEGEGGLGFGAAVGEGFAHQAEVERSCAEQPFQEAEFAECGKEWAVDAAGFALLREGAQSLRGEAAQFGAPGGLCRFERECGHPVPHFLRPGYGAGGGAARRPPKQIIANR